MCISTKNFSHDNNSQKNNFILTYFFADSNLYTLWMFFSAKENFSHLVPLEVKETGPMDVFHGIKFLSILVVIFGHRVGIGLSFSAANYEDVETTLLRDHKMFFTQSDLVVDTFFFISGLLACYVMMGIFTKQFINPILAIFVRIYRQLIYLVALAFFKKFKKIFVVD